MTEQFEAYTASARERAEWWRLVATVLLTAVIVVAGIFGMFALVGIYAPERAPELERGGTPFGVMVFLLSFAWFHVGLGLSVRLFHRRGFGTLLGPRGSRLRHFWFGTAFAVGLVFVPFVLAPLDAALFPGEFKPPRFVGDVGVWATFLVPALIAILVQTSAEEVVFRGYLLQQLAARSKSMLIWAVLPSALFAALHFNPGTFGVNTWFHMLHTLVVGTLLALVTARTGNLGAAIGLHFANNAVGFLLFGLRGFEDGLALFVYDFDLKGAYVTYGLLVQTAVSIVGYLVWTRWMNRRDRRLQSA